MNNYTTSTNEQVLQQYLAGANTFPHSAHSLALPALHSMAALGGSTASASSLLNNLHSFSAFNSLALAMAAHQTNPTSSPLSSTNSSVSNPAALNSGAPMFAALLQAQQRLNGLSATSLLQKYDQTNNSQQSPSSVSSCSSPPTCSSVTPPTPPPTTTATSLQLLAQHYNHLQSTMNSSTSSTITLSNSLNNAVAASTTTNATNIPSSLSSVAAAAVLSGQPNLNLSSLVAANSHLSTLDAASKRLAVSPDTDASNELVDIQQQYYSQLNALRQQLLLSSTAGLASSFNPTANSATLLNKPAINPLNQQPIKDLAKLYTAINCNTGADLNSPISSSLSNSSSSTSSLQNTMTSLQQQQMMAAMASTGSFAHNAHMHLLSPNSIKSLKFSIENILSPSFGNSPAELAAAINQQTQSANLTNSLSNSLSSSLSNSLTGSSPMSKLLEFNKQAKNGLTPTSNGTASSNKLTNFLNSNNATTKQQISNKLEQVNSNINGLSSIINNLNPGLGALDFKLNTSKRKKRSSISMDDAGENEPIRNVKRKNSIDSDCSNSNSSIGQTKLNSTNNSSTNGNDIKPSVDKADLKANDSSNDKNTKLPSPEEVLAGQPIPAWVFCTRYSDRPSSGKLFTYFFVKIFVDLLDFVVQGVVQSFKPAI